MGNLLADLDPKTFWNAPNGSSELWMKIVVALLIGFAATAALLAAPPRFRRPIVVLVTFLSGLYYVALFLYPSPIDRSGPEVAPRHFGESISFWLDDAQPIAANLANTVAAFLLGLGVYSLLRIHLRKVIKQQRDWGYSLILVLSLLSMVLFGYWDWGVRQSEAGNMLAFLPSPNWHLEQFGRDLLFNGLLQQMDAAMFSIIGFYILSAAYRAFRARSIEATVLLLAALVMILSLMGLATYGWNSVVNHLPSGAGQNLQLTEIAKWIKNNLQTSSIRGLDFGVGIGLLAMGLRLWLSLERIGAEA